MHTPFAAAAAIWTSSLLAQQLFVDTNDRGFRKRFAAAAARREAELRAAFAEAQVDAIELSTDDDLVETVMRFADLKRRGRHSKRFAAAS